jgi:hypothetical protein
MTVRALLALVTAMGVADASAAVRPGVYDALILGYTPATQTLTGYFSSSTGAGQFNCIFYLKGHGGGATTRIETWFPVTPSERIGGTLRGEAGGRVSILLDEEPGGCAMVNPFADKSRPAEFDLASAHDWIEVRVVHAKKSYFYDAPGAATHRRGYLVQGDGVGVKAAVKGWLQVDYPGPDKTVSGWVKDADLYPGP